MGTRSDPGRSEHENSDKQIPFSDAKERNNNENEEVIIQKEEVEHDLTSKQEELSMDVGRDEEGTERNDDKKLDATDHTENASAMISDTKSNHDQMDKLEVKERVAEETEHTSSSEEPTNIIEKENTI